MTQPNDKPGQLHFTLAIAVLFAGLAIGVVLGLAELDLEGGALALALLGPLFWVVDRRLNSSLLVGPAIYIYIVHLLGYAIGPLGQRYLCRSDETFSAHGMWMAQWGAVLGLVTFAPVYYATFRFVERRALPERAKELPPDDPRWAGFTSILVVAATVITAYTHLTGAARRLGQFDIPDIEVQTAAAAFSSVQQLVFLFLAFIAARRRTVLAFGSWATAILLYSAYTFLEGTRGLTFVAIIVSCIGFVLGGLPRKTIMTSLMGLVAILIPVSGIVVYYRSTPEYASRYDEGVAGRLDAFSSAASEFESQSSLGARGPLDVFFESVTALTVDRIMEQTPDRVPFAGFRDLDRLVYVWTPRLIAPDRPSLYEGNDIANEYGTGHDGIRSWAYTPTVGEGYRRFGWIGIPIVYIIVAIVFGGTTGLCWARRRQREWAALLGVCFLEAGSAWSSTIITAVSRLLWILPKYFVFFYGLRYLQDFASSLLRQGRWPGSSPSERSPSDHAVRMPTSGLP